MTNPESKPIIVLDFGAQYSKLIARRVREANVFSLILPYTASVEEIRGHDPSAIILSGGPASVHADGAPKCEHGVFELGLPLLGICYGAQLMAQELGGEVVSADKREYGIAHLTHTDSTGFPDGMDPQAQGWMSHCARVARPPCRPQPTRPPATHQPWARRPACRRARRCA